MISALKKPGLLRRCASRSDDEATVIFEPKAKQSSHWKAPNRLSLN
jgi:hypothetical protein